MARTLEGMLDASGMRIALVVSRVNGVITDRLLAGAEDCLERHGCTADRRTVVRVPGSWEIPQATRRLARAGGYDAIVALGALVRGETPHFDLLASVVTRGLADAAAESGVPVAFGVLTTDTVEQALDRSGAKAGNKGWDAALSAIEIAALFRHMGERSSRTAG
jgi:6,7-dimethyl-8-ribityllumazine synthase